ncbi:hypothetical protein EKO03_22605 [Enterobacter quasiroggenkampii]|uniref:Putative endonuclease SegE-like GIY-YIG domain-containing protein n=1 Tax=Enterobacter kobei TaxID=208224 RepID=A0AAJ6LN80_9ENTR|nr:MULTISPECIES: hypothetical protein [Enterobacteriaceae]RTM73690.1 hypothetical protein EKO03_22605 [Enterobacter quasiroggenkampii]UAN35205.1 hypothetical protein KGP18_15805 [Enterobacter asburiae]WMT67223.1 hypothetical protein M2B19_06530 [Enterobacter kobei]
MEAWQYNEDWSEKELTNGSYVGFVYLFQFEDNTSYIGSKQMYKRIKDIKKLKDNSIENGWREYSSSSKIVNSKIEEGVNYTRTILWAFPSMKETLFVETALIINEGLKTGNLNLAVMHKARLPSGKDAVRIRRILQSLYEILN